MRFGYRIPSITKRIAAAGCTPSIEFTVLGDEVKLTCNSNLIPGSYTFNCFDLLEAAKQAMGAQKQIFERVEIRAVDEQYVVADRIEGELDSDDYFDKEEKYPFPSPACRTQPHGSAMSPHLKRWYGKSNTQILIEGSSFWNDSKSPLCGQCRSTSMQQWPMER